MKGRRIKWGLLFVCLAVLASLPWILNACGGSSSTTPSTTTHTMTLKGATS